MTTLRKGTSISEMGNSVMPFSKGLNATRADIACRACEPRGFCLAAEMMEHKGQIDLIRQNCRTTKRGDHIFREGDESTALYMVKSGSVKSYLITQDGEEQVLGFFMPGDVLGLDGMGIEHYISSCVALELTNICKLPFPQLSDHGRGCEFPKLIAEHLSRYHNLILMLARKDADARLACFLIDLANRFERNGYSNHIFNLSMSRQDIGSYLGLAIETVSRTLTRFQESGLLDARRRKIELLDIPALKRIAGAQASR